MLWLLLSEELRCWERRIGAWVCRCQMCQATPQYVSLGFPRLPESFWQKSDLYPVDKPSPRKKNSHASAWHIDRENDVRSLMSVEPNQQWFGTAHHELGHIGRHAVAWFALAPRRIPEMMRDEFQR